MKVLRVCENFIWGYDRGRMGSGSCSNNKDSMCIEEISRIGVYAKTERKKCTVHVRSGMVYGNETSVMKVGNVQIMDIRNADGETDMWGKT